LGTKILIKEKYEYMERTKKPEDDVKKVVKQVKDRAASSSVKERKEYEGNIEKMISTGSTLLDLAISGGRVRGGGIPSGILVEIFGPSGAGKTVMLCEIAGAIQRQGGEIMFHDPEARLNKQFARMFDLNTEVMDYKTPDTIPEVFSAVRKWDPGSKGKVHGVFADSLAALSTNMEMGSDDGDKMGMRRAKEFSEELRRTCRVITKNDLLMVCSNQVRQNADAGPYGVKYSTPGGLSIGFYASLRLRANTPEKIKVKRTIAGKEVVKVIGVETKIEVFKSSIWKPFNVAPLIILFDYGIDDIRANLQYIKTYTKATTYVIGGEKLAVSLEDAIAIIERDNRQEELRQEVIDLWEEIEKKFESDRMPKQR